ncbi:MAG: alkaline phosphatase family protein [Rhodomicrobium sp.]
MPSKTRKSVLLSTLAGVLAVSVAVAAYAQERGTRDGAPVTASPIKHLIVIIGENRTFDHVFGVYKPRPGETVSNLLSKGIVTEDGKPGPHFELAQQYKAAPQPSYFIAAQGKTPYGFLPPPQLEGTPNEPGTKQPPFTVIPEGAEPGLAPADLHLLTTGATGLPDKQGPDLRVPGAEKLPNGPFQLTGPNLPYDSYTADPVHRFYQMWQQSDCSAAQATPANPSGCLSDLYPYTAISSSSKEQGGTSMAFYNVLQGDAPYLKALADEYTMSDNYHQAQMGGTMVEHFYIAFADNLYYSDGKGNAIPPSDFAMANPNPKSLADSHFSSDHCSWFTNCSDASEPGVAPILSYLASLPYKPASKCEAGHYYVLNNMTPGYKADGSPDKGEKALPPTTVRSIGDALSEKGISFRYYGGGYQGALSGKKAPYCDLCNPFQFQASIMGNQASRAEHLKDVQDLLSDIEGGTLPAVSYVKPDWWTDGHPQSSKLGLFEAFTRNVIERVKAKPELFADTAIFVTFDEGGGYYDSGFIQPLDFFGDGPRIPFIAVSPYATGGRVVHGYADHASVVKFIERNWGLAPLSARSRDNLPNPKTDARNRYAPVNSPAIDDLYGMFDFGRK